MADLKPFNGLLYDGTKIDDDYSGVVAPPYDVISDEMRDELYNRNTHNIIRLVLGKSFDNDNDENNKYTRAKDFLDEWQDEKVLIGDDIAAFYVYSQEYEVGDKKCLRTGFIGLMKIGRSNGDTVLPHERTLAAPKEDRLNLIKQVKSNMSPIFTLYNGAGSSIPEILNKTMRDGSPVIDIKEDGVRHQLQRISDADSIEQIVSQMKDKRIFIADGHHRYEVAKTYRDLCCEKKECDGKADYIMTYFTDMNSDNGLRILPIHRAIKTMPLTGDTEIAEKLNLYFDVTVYSDLAGLMERLDKKDEKGHKFGYFGGNGYLFFRSKEEDRILNIIKEDRSEEWKQLDVSVLHSAVFSNILCVDDGEDNITYAKDHEKAEAMVKNGSHMAAFFLNHTPVWQLKAVAERGEMMPQKSTYFYPKLLTGLVINQF